VWRAAHDGGARPPRQPGDAHLTALHRPRRVRLLQAQPALPEGLQHVRSACAASIGRAAHHTPTSRQQVYRDGLPQCNNCAAKKIDPVFRLNKKFHEKKKLQEKDAGRPLSRTAPGRRRGASR
jgi:hypothetical protein